ncbi:MAG: hypothetical protein AAGB35_00700 [Pseudomonadota bacterium]
MARPHIQSAFPKQRYQFGEFSITLLADVQSNDPIDYLYIIAVMREGNTEPEVYITCEMTSSKDAKPAYRVRVLSDQQEHVISTDSQWGNEKAFCEFALEGIKQMFELTDEEPKALG